MPTTNASMHHAVTSSTAAQVIGDGADLGLVNVSLGENPRQHGKCGDAHRRAHEERHRRERHLRRIVEEPRIKIERQRRTQQKRRDDAGVADDDGLVAAILEQLGIEFQADEEQEEDHPELAEDIE